MYSDMHNMYYAEKIINELRSTFQYNEIDEDIDDYHMITQKDGKININLRNVKKHNIKPIINRAFTKPIYGGDNSIKITNKNKSYYC